MKIVSSGNTISSSENYKKKKREKKRRVAILSIAAFILFIGLVLLSRVDKFLIKNVRVVGAQVITQDEVSANVLKSISGNYLWVIPRNNAVIYSRKVVKENLSREFPRFSSISLSLENADGLTVRVSERKPFALYCSDAKLSREASACFFIDESGFIFDEAPSFSGTVYFVYALEKPLENPEGNYLIPEKEFRSLSAFVKDLPRLSIEPISVELKEREYEIVAKNGAHLIWNKSDNISTVFSNLEAFLKSEQISTDENFIDKVETLDLRTKNKVFYRFRE